MRRRISLLLKRRLAELQAEEEKRLFQAARLAMVEKWQAEERQAAAVQLEEERWQRIISELSKKVPTQAGRIYVHPQIPSNKEANSSTIWPAILPTVRGSCR